MAFGLLSTGFSKMRLADIKPEIEASLRSVLGSSINLLPASIFGQLIGVFSEREASLWDLGEEVYNSQYPDTGSGTSLDNISAITGITRLGADFTRVRATLTGVSGTQVLAGTVFSVLGNPVARFQADSTVTLISGTALVDCTAEVTGPTQVLAGTLTVIETPVTGLTAVTNVEDGTLGRNLETDAELRIRRAETLQKAGAAAIDAIRARLLDLSGVTDVIAFENDTLVTDLAGRPAKSFEMVVNGGDEQLIADTIWAAKAGGIRTYGSETTSVTDSQGIARQINWSRPTLVPIYLIVNIIKTNQFPAGGAAEVQSRIVANGNSLGIGNDVIVYPGLILSVAGIPGIIDIDILVSKNPTPTLSDNIDILPNEIAVFDLTRTEVNVT
jgi:uncharacterized phage protein gp47/JayE